MTEKWAWEFRLRCKFNVHNSTGCFDPSPLTECAAGINLGQVRYSWGGGRDEQRASQKNPVSLIHSHIPKWGFSSSFFNYFCLTSSNSVFQARTPTVIFDFSLSLLSASKHVNLTLTLPRVSFPCPHITPPKWLWPILYFPDARFSASMQLSALKSDHTTSPV